ncbi:LTA synthase family protein [Isobaculum melis]|nr:LTA synthase family protein [Isobaculum melis]
MRLGFFTLLTFLFWLKTYLSYQLDFSLGVVGPAQQFILAINPIATTIFIFGIALYMKNTKASYIWMMILYILNTILLYANIMYYREFTDFLTVNTMLGVKSVSAGLNTSGLALAKPHDVIYLLDIAILIGLLAFKVIKMDPKPLKKRVAFAFSAIALLIFSINLGLAEANRPELLKRTFDRNYIVKYLGINVFTIHDGISTAQKNQIRAQASESDMDEVLEYMKENEAPPKDALFGVAKGKNVIYIHLESFQQFLLDYQLEGQTVTPFLNSIYHDASTFSFPNFFHQVGQGKTSDAETMLETSLFGIQQGSVFTQYGTENTFQAAPAILKEEGYTSASFHGNGGSFWNRDNTYRSLGYDYFFDSSYYSNEKNMLAEYGLKDKIFLKESVKYLEQLQQPFYSKFITVSNHFPYPEDELNADFPRGKTGDSSIDGYFQTAHYLDEAVQEFFKYLKDSGLYDNSIIVLYGDHYGISTSRNPTLAPLLGKDEDEWNSYNNAMMQRVPFMVHIPGQTGGMFEQYGGQTDVLPTLLHLLGISTTDYVQFGTDLFSEKHNQVVAFRNGDFVTPKYTKMGATVYDTATGNVLEDLTPAQQEEIDQAEQSVDTRLGLSDKVINGDLLRYYTPANFSPVDKAAYNYHKQMEQLEEIRNELGDQSTSLYSKNGNKSTEDLYQTNAPELKDKE